MKRVLAVASSGGHWVQLMRLRPALQDCETVYVSTNSAYENEVSGAFYTVTDANAWQKLRMLRMFAEMAYLVFRLRPQVVISTGAAPGFAAILFGRLSGARTLWIESIANSEELSRSGRLAIRVADVSLTQWEHLAKSGGPEFWGAVL